MEDKKIFRVDPGVLLVKKGRFGCDFAAVRADMGIETALVVIRTDLACPDGQTVAFGHLDLAERAQLDRASLANEPKANEPSMALQTNFGYVLRRNLDRILQAGDVSMQIGENFRRVSKGVESASIQIFALNPVLAQMLMHVISQTSGLPQVSYRIGEPETLSLLFDMNAVDLGRMGGALRGATLYVPAPKVPSLPVRMARKVAKPLGWLLWWIGDNYVRGGKVPSMTPSSQQPLRRVDLRQGRGPAVMPIDIK